MDARPPESRLDLSIIIVCYNDREVLVPCLESIYASAPSMKFEVIVVDNASVDGSAAEIRRRFPQVRVIDAGYNSGFTGGNNIGYDHSSGKWVLFLNPDTIILDKAIDQLMERAVAIPNLGAIGPNVRNKDRTLQRSVYRSPRLVGFVDAFLLNRLPLYSKLFGYFGYRDADYANEMEVDIVCGCCFAVPRPVLEEVGAFDKGYFIYYEEADLQERIRESGKKVVYTPAASIVHLGGATTVKQQTWFRIECECSRKRFFQKHRNRLSQLVLGPILFADSIARLVFNSVAVVLTAGTSAHFRKHLGIEYALLLWQLGLQEHEPIPPKPAPKPALQQVEPRS
jgi:GT2 family glycosyltransferase